jgi:hypothetical protein
MSQFVKWLSLSWYLSMMALGCTQPGDRGDSENDTFTGPVACSVDSDCPPPAYPCEVAVCVGNVCGSMVAPPGTPANGNNQIAGDCKRLACGEGGIVAASADPSDLPLDDGNACTLEVCDGPNPSHTDAPAGSACTTAGVPGTCNREGLCEPSVAGLVIQPSNLDFGIVEPNQSKTESLTLLNTGSDTVSISKIYFSGHLGFSFILDGIVYDVTPNSASNGITLPAPLQIAAGNTHSINVNFIAVADESARATLLFMSNDPSAPNGTEVKLIANVRGPCLQVNPSRIDFGGQVVGELSERQVEVESCGETDLILADVALIDDGDGAFDIDLGGLAAFPLVIPTGQSVIFSVTYLAQAAAARGSDGQPERDTGSLRIRSNDSPSQQDVELSGFGSDGSCPTAVINVAQGEEVLPQTRLQLDASASTASSGRVTGWEWSVTQPSGSVSTFLPSAYVEKPTFEVNIIGTYTFRLKVFDELGIESCTQAEYVVNVTSDDAIHVELLWRTPGDINESDTGGGMDFSAGSDLDLHFLHPEAKGQYFDYTYDCYWENPLPEWGIFSPSDNPRLDRDDTDGAGPENLNVKVGEQNVRYQIGVHYWNDWGYGPAYTTVRVYIYGILRDEWKDVSLVNADMWDTHYLDWPSGVVTRITEPGGAPRITSQYPVPGLNGGLPF